METEDLQRNAGRIREREYHSFLDIYQGDHAAALNPPLQPPPSSTDDRDQRNAERERKINALHHDVYASAYLRRFDQAALREAFKALEALPAGPDAVKIRTTELARKCRELLFLRRFAQIVKWQDYERCPPTPKELRSRHQGIAKACLSLEALLLDQLEDEYLLRKLHNSDLEALPEFIKQLGRFSEVFENIKPDLPYDRKRNPDNWVMRLVVSDLAECCFQIYEACTYEIVRDLLKSCWLRPHAAVRRGVLAELIDGTLQRKVTDYKARTAPLEDQIPAPHILWMPVRSL